MKSIVVGCGISGASIARFLVGNNDKVVIIDQKDHVGGNCYDYFDSNGIDIHQYGTHIFHTETKMYGIFYLDLLNGIHTSTKLKH